MPPGLSLTNRIMATGFKVRWCFLIVWLAAFLIWWAAYVEGSLVRHFPQLEWISGNKIIQVFHYTWLGDDGNSYRHGSFLPNGLDGVFGINTRRYRSNGVPILSGSALFLTVMFTTFWVTVFVPLYVGVRKKTMELLPAKVPFAVLPRLIASFMCGLCVAGYTAIAIDAAFNGWTDFVRFDYVWIAPGLKHQVRGTIWVGIGFVLSITTLIFIASFLLFRGKPYRYWQLERGSRWILFLGIGLLIVCGFLWGASKAGYLRHSDAMKSADFAAWTTVTWALGCRTWLLFRLKRFEKLKLVHDRESPECFACGYNLRGSVMAGSKRCPECGVSIPRELLAVDVPRAIQKRPES